MRKRLVGNRGSGLQARHDGRGSVSDRRLRRRQKRDGGSARVVAGRWMKKRRG